MITNTTFLISLLDDFQSYNGYLTPININSTANIAIINLKYIVSTLPNGVFLDALNNYVNFSIEVNGYTDNNILTGTIYDISDVYRVTTDSIVYTLRSTTDLTQYYIGSAVNGITRLIDHHKGISIFSGYYGVGVHTKLIELGGIIKYTIVYTIPNFCKTIINYLNSINYNISQGEWYILQALTIIIPRILEQNLLNKYKPILNKSINVLYSYLTWNPTFLKIPKDKFNRNPIEIRDWFSGKLLYICISTTAAVKHIGLSWSTIHKYLNLQCGVISPTYSDRVTISRSGASLINSNSNSKINKSPNYPITILPNGKIISDLKPFEVWLLSSCKNYWLGPYNNFTEAAKDTNIGSNVKKRAKSYSYWCNYNRVVNTNKGNFYILRNKIKIKLNEFPYVY